MKLAIISDIHANATALKLVLGFLKARGGVEKIFCLGDIVGFHTSPGECIDLVRENVVTCIAGNHDAGVAGSLGEKKFPWECWEAIQWTRKNITHQQLRFLESLPHQTIVDNAFWMMHGIFGDPHHYMVGDLKHQYAFLRLRFAGIRLGFYGHIHKQTCFKKSLKEFSSAIEPMAISQPVVIEQRAAYLMNPGTVGQPRTNDPHARFAIVDLDEGLITFEKIPYDYSTVLDRTLGVFPRHTAIYKRFGSIPD